MTVRTPVSKQTALSYAKALVTAGHSEDSIRRSLLSIYGSDEAYEDITAAKLQKKLKRSGY